MDGLYKIVFSAEAHAVVGLDGQHIITSRPKSETRKIEGYWCKLKKGPHLFRIMMHNNKGGGRFSLGLITPPLMRIKPLRSNQVAWPRLGNLDTWWWIMQLSKPLVIFFTMLSITILLALVLPSAADNNKKSIFITLALIITPAILIPNYSPQEPDIGPTIHKALQTKQPRFVFIGNSMLWSRIDDKLLEKMLGGVPVYSIVNFGGLSGIHYLALKHLLIPSGIHPKRVFIFFRNTTLVNPGARTTGPYFEALIKRICPKDDSEFERIAHGRNSANSDRVQSVLNTILSVQGNRPLIRGMMRKTALWLSLPGTDKERETERAQLLQQVNQRFALKNIGSEHDQESVHKEEQGAIPDFNTAVKGSFLPAIIALGREHHLPLAFIRVQERPPKNGIMQDTPAMRRFMAAQQRYLKKNGVDFYDFTGDPELPLSMYGQGDHIEDPKKYTPIFYQRLKGLLQ